MVSPPEPVETRRLEPITPDDSAGSFDYLPAPFDAPWDDSMPADFAPWWQKPALTPLVDSKAPIVLDLDAVIVETLRHSARVREISDNAVIAETAITRAAAEFDYHAFMETKFTRRSVPTGSTLDAGFNVPRLREADWFHVAGLRRRNRLGGRTEISQRIGTRDSNSLFFFPQNQGNSRLTLSYHQPLLNGAGRAYNTSLTLLASLDTKIASDVTAAELQDQLLAVTETYWGIYLQRAALLQKERHLERATEALTRLEKRREVDALESQIARAKAAVATRRTELIRASTAIRDAESRLRALVNAPLMLADRSLEIVPRDPPRGAPFPIDLPNALVLALENRPEIDAAAQAVEAARVRLGVARNELWPVLDLALETYLSGLRGDFNIGRSLIDQYSVGEPSYSAGLLFEVPLQRRAAKANMARRQAELSQLASRFEVTVETIRSEVEIAAREVETSYRELQARYESMLAANADTRYWQSRWESLPGDDRSASLLLDDLLDSQDRLVASELEFSQRQFEYTLSQTRFNRAVGLLLKSERVVVVREQGAGAPRLRFEKSEIETAPYVGDHD